MARYKIITADKIYFSDTVTKFGKAGIIYLDTVDGKPNIIEHDAVAAILETAERDVTGNFRYHPGYDED